MRRILTSSLLCLSPLVFPGTPARSQSIPANVGAVSNIGFPVPEASGTFNYSLNASELISSGFFNGSGTDYTTNLSGDMAYLSGSQTHPFSAIYTGGVLLANSGQPNTTYQSLSLSQVLKTKDWNFEIQDAVSYLPESPVTGLSGIPGVGDIGIDPVPVGPEAGIGILTTYGPRVSNTVSGSVSRIITGRLSAVASGYSGIQRFLGDNAQYGTDNATEGGSGGLMYDIDGRSSVRANYDYSRFSYVNTPYQFTTQGATVEYARQWTHRFTTDVYVGPEHITYSNAAFGSPSNQIAGGASASFAGRIAFYTLSYNRGVNNGSGVIVGSFSDNVTGGAHRQFGRNWGVSGTIGYSRTTSLPGTNLYSFDSDSVAVGGQVVRAIGRRFSGYASYTVEEQSTAGSASALNAFTGTYQVFGIGISYSPGSLFLGR